MSAAASPNPPPSPIDWAWPASNTNTNANTTSSSSQSADSAPPTTIIITPQHQHEHQHGDSSPPLTSAPPELQFLPPAASAFPQSSSSSVSPSWDIDPSRLKQLMMGSISSCSNSANALPHTNVISPRSLADAAPLLRQNSSSRDLGALFDHGVSKPLPSGYERCLDLMSGEVFVKKADGKATSQSQPLSRVTQIKDWTGSLAGGSRPVEVASMSEQRQDWSLRWPQGKEQDSSNSGKGFISAAPNIFTEESSGVSPDRDSLCLDLDLRLTSEKRTRVNIDAANLAPTRSSETAVCRLAIGRAPMVLPQNTVQQWKWLGTSSTAIPTSIQEMVRESTMATAVCSQCLMYVLLKKSNPTCPRCSNPIILDNGVTQPASKKRPGLELSADDLSLSTDSSM